MNVIADCLRWHKCYKIISLKIRREIYEKIEQNFYGAEDDG